MTSCGLVLSRRRLLAVAVDDNGRAAPALAADLDDDGRWGLLARIDTLHGLDCELVIPEDVLRADRIGQLAIEQEMNVWVAPVRLVEAIRDAAGFATGPPARLAATIARLVLVPGFRGHLRRLHHLQDCRQLPLL